MGRGDQEHPHALAMAAPVALVDCNNFYASCERLFQPALRGQPVVVLSNNDGCVIARSNEAKALGIGMGEPWHLHKAKVEQSGVIVRSSNYTLYGDLSARVMRTLAQFSPDMEVYSIDEAFLGLAGFELRLDAHAREMRATVLQWTGIPVSVGIAPTKTLAKAANRAAKKDPASGGVLSIASDAEIEAVLSRMELTDLWGIADRMAVRLTDFGVRTPLDLRQADARLIRERFSVVMERMVLELQGIPCSRLETETPDRKSLVASRSFGQPITTLAEMEQAVASYVSRRRKNAPARSGNLPPVGLHPHQPIPPAGQALLRFAGGFPAGCHRRHQKARHGRPARPGRNLARWLPLQESRRDVYRPGSSHQGSGRSLGQSRYARDTAADEGHGRA